MAPWGTGNSGNSGGSDSATGGNAGVSGSPSGGNAGAGGTVVDAGCTKAVDCGPDPSCWDCLEGTCVEKAASTECNRTCIQAVETVSHCASGGVCVLNVTIPCDPFACDPGTNACRMSCSSSSDCAPGHLCTTPQCTACDLCSTQLLNLAKTPSWCPADSQALFTKITDCCATCIADCGSNLCAPDPTGASSACLSCLLTQCPTDYKACQTDLVE